MPEPSHASPTLRDEVRCNRQSGTGDTKSFHGKTIVTGQKEQMVQLGGQGNLPVELTGLTVWISGTAWGG
jgi:hypothetical protein